MNIKHRAIKELKKIFSYTQLAELLELPVGTVKGICSRTPHGLSLSYSVEELVEFAQATPPKTYNETVERHTAILAKCLDNRQREQLLELLCTLEPSCVEGSQTHEVIHNLLVACVVVS